VPETEHPAAATAEPVARPPCPAPADFRKAVADYDARARVAVWNGPRYRMTYRVLGEGPPLILIPGVSSTYRGYALSLNILGSRFKTVVYDYPGDQSNDGAQLRRITHDDLVDDVSGLIDHLNLGRVFLFGLSFGSTIMLRALHREPRRFPKAAVQGAFARREFSLAEKLALRFGRLIPGTVARLPLHETILAYNNKYHFPDIIADRWSFYAEQNGLTPIASLAARLDLLGKVDLRPILSEIKTELLILQGNEDRLVARRYYDELCAGIPNARGVIMPLVGHQPHFTHAEALADAVGEWFLPCAPGGCPNDAAGTG
jgi:pimeloyl-ACP methyl ester carboxylesterase